MFTKRELLRISKVAGELFDYYLTSRLIPHPNRIVWLNPVSGAEYFPDYVLNDLFHLSYLQRCGVRALWDLKKCLLGGQGTIKYEADLQRMFGDIFYSEVASNQSEVSEKLYQQAQDSFSSQKIVSATFRAERLKDKAFLVLSRVVLKPRNEFFNLELVRSHSEDAQERLTHVYRIIVKGARS